MRGLIGVLGGMGPLATVDFMRKIVVGTPAACDQEHLPLLVYSVPQIPDRGRAIGGLGPSPLPALLAGLHTLEAAGAACIAMPCNTAHHWFDDLARVARAELLHIADATIARLDRPGGVGLLATAGTVASGLYQRRLAARGITVHLPDTALQADVVAPAIAAVKAGRIDVAARGLRDAARALAGAGATGVILGCSELPVAAERLGDRDGLPRLIDATAALADAVVAWGRRAG